MKEFLAAHPYIGLGASFGTAVGTKIASFFIAINPFLQFLGLAAGLWIAYLTIEAKLAERKERKNKRLGYLNEKMREKEVNAKAEKNGKSK